MNFYIKIYETHKIDFKNKMVSLTPALPVLSEFRIGEAVSMQKGYKSKLNPNNKQRTQLFKNAGTARFAYNFALDRLIDYYKETGKYLSDREIRKEITQLKQNELSWLYEYDCDIVKQAVKDACKAYYKFIKYLSDCKKNHKNPEYKKGSLKRKRNNSDYVLTDKDLKHYPRFKSKRKSMPSFYVDVLRIHFNDGKMDITKLKNIDLYEKDYIPENTKYYNPRITFDGIDWWVSVSVEEDFTKPKLNGHTLAIDTGVKELATCSDGTVYHNITKDRRFKKLNKSIKQKQRQVSRKYEQNKTEDGKFQKTQNIIKLEERIRKKQIKQNNMRMDYFHKTTTEIVRTKPSRIVHEDLNVQGMMQNRHLSKAIQQASMSMFLTLLDAKAEKYGIEVIKADRYFPSSKLCSHCGQIKKYLKLSDRVYKCSECGFELDRDLNAAINLAAYPESQGKLSLRRVTQTKVA